MTIQTPITPAAADDLVEETIRALQSRADALSQTHRDLHAIYLTSLRASTDAVALVDTVDVISGAILQLSASDQDIIDRLRDQLRAPDHLCIIRIASDAISRSYRVNARAQEILDRQEAAAYRRELRERKQAVRSAYTVAYEAAIRLSVSKRRQLAEALLEF